MKSKLPPVSQDWFNDNRERFNAESFTLPTKFDKCTHYFIRKTGSTIGCKNCTANWIDTELQLKDGKLASS